MGNLFNLQNVKTRKNKIADSSMDRIIAVPANNVEAASVLRSIESRPLQGLPRNINRSVRQVNVKNTLPTITTTTGLIDVINNFDWTTTPSRAGSGQDFKVPAVRVQEFEMDRLSVLKSIRYQIETFANAVEDNAAAFNNVIANVQKLQQETQAADKTSTGNILGNAFGDTIINAIGTIAKTTSNIVPVNAQQIISSTSNFFQGFASAFGVDDSRGENSSSQWLRMLNGLYTLNSTKFEYIFPYLEDRAMDASPRFASFDAVLKSNISKGVASAVMGLTQGPLAAVPELSQPGVYVEQPQLMDISNANSSDITVTFPLLNTLSFENAVKNYQLLWLLAYQNKPYRESKTVVSPAKVYRVFVPGIKYMHFAHISNLSVDFMGVRRTVRIPMPTIAGTPEQVNVIMPDAYRVSITFKSLTTDMGNFMIEQLKRGAQF